VYEHSIADVVAGGKVGCWSLPMCAAQSYQPAFGSGLHVHACAALPAAPGAPACRPRPLPAARCRTGALPPLLQLSAPQMETVVYASMKFHGPRLVDGKRAGFFLGDGAGVGKGRQVGGPAGWGQLPSVRAAAGRCTQLFFRSWSAVSSPAAAEAFRPLGSPHLPVPAPCAHGASPHPHPTPPHPTPPAQIAALVRQHSEEGGRRALWVSVSTDLRKDAERDLADVGSKMALFPKVEQRFSRSLRMASASCACGGRAGRVGPCWAGVRQGLL
jgi:hypothetical protein